MPKAKAKPTVKYRFEATTSAYRFKDSFWTWWLRIEGVNSYPNVGEYQGHAGTRKQCVRDAQKIAQALGLEVEWKAEVVSED